MHDNKSPTLASLGNSISPSHNSSSACSTLRHALIFAVRFVSSLIFLHIDAALLPGLYRDRFERICLCLQRYQATDLAAIIVTISARNGTQAYSISPIGTLQADRTYGACTINVTTHTFRSNSVNQRVPKHHALSALLSWSPTHTNLLRCRAHLSRQAYIQVSDYAVSCMRSLYPAFSS